MYIYINIHNYTSCERERETDSPMQTSAKRQSRIKRERCWILKETSFTGIGGLTFATKLRPETCNKSSSTNYRSFAGMQCGICYNSPALPATGSVRSGLAGSGGVAVACAASWSARCSQKQQDAASTGGMFDKEKRKKSSSDHHGCQRLLKSSFSPVTVCNST